jgi:chlorophyllide a reductase subunit X
LASIPANEDIRRKSANYQIIGTPDSEWGGLFAGLALAVADSLPQHPRPLSQDGLLGLFSPEQTGGAVNLIPASQSDMRGASYVPKASLEVVYDEAV